MAETIKVRCKNTAQTYNIATGSKLWDAYEAMGCPLGSQPPVAAKVNNKTEGMHYRLYKNKQVEFLDITSPSGRRTYTRTLFFVLCKAVHDIYPESIVIIDIPVSNGYYCDIRLFDEPLPAEVRDSSIFDPRLIE